jgi:hypothetical protein
MTQLQALHLMDCTELEELPDLSGFVALQTLELRSCKNLRQLPPLATLAALQKLVLTGCAELLGVATFGHPPSSSVASFALL